MMKAKFGHAVRNKTDTHDERRFVQDPLPRHLLSDFSSLRVGD